MNIPADELTKVIFNKPLTECSSDELLQLVQQYPYFGPAHLLLTKKLKEDNSSLYEEQVQNTSLYFQNRIWLQHLLNGDGNADIITGKKETAFLAEGYDQPVEATGTKEERTEEQPGTPVELPVVKTEPGIPVFTNENKDMAPPIEDSKEEIKETTLLADRISLKIEPVSPDDKSLFEPYHTVDYFASQGIKYKEEEKPTDRFSVQLKSFTEWLKTMKRAPMNELVAKTDPVSEKKVEQLAEYSLAEKHVITEAMAEVWKKQGNKAKAEDIYNKLSLLDPSKSSYFAAKIEELKKTS